MRQKLVISLILVSIIIGGTLVYIILSNNCDQSLIDEDYPVKFSRDQLGNIIIVASTTDDNMQTTLPVLGTRNPESNWDADILVYKYSSQGNLLWSLVIAGQTDDRPSDLVIDSQNAIYIGGITQSLNFPTSGGSHYFDDIAGNVDGFILKLSSEGEMLWSYRLSSTKDEELLGMDIDQNNDIYIVGSVGVDDFHDFPSNAYLISESDYSQTQIPSMGFVMSFTSAGEVQINSRIARGIATRIDDIEVGKSGGIIGLYHAQVRSNTENMEFSTERESKVFLFRNETIQWSMDPRDDGEGYISYGKLASNSKGDILIGYSLGETTDGIKPGTRVVKMDQLGTVQWRQDFSGGYKDIGDLSVSSTDSIIVSQRVKLVDHSQEIRSGVITDILDNGTITMEYRYEVESYNILPYFAEISQDGFVVFLGLIERQTDWGSIPNESNDHRVTGYQDIYIAQTDHNGTILWNNYIGGYGREASLCG